MTFRRNVIASYASQIYVTLIGIAMLPIYVRFLGAEAYGLVGFFVVLQTWFQLLDMGLSPTLARETARLQGSSGSTESLRNLLRSLEGVFLVVACLGALALLMGAEQIAGHWLNLDRLPKVEAAYAIQLMALVIVLRWIGELYRGVITGYERMVWLGGFTAIMATIRFVVIVPFFMVVSSDIIDFFYFQLLVAIAETAFLTLKAYTLLPTSPNCTTRWSVQPLRRIMGFAMAMGFATVVWVAASQTDKLLLSGLLSLSDYGRFSLTVSAAGGVLMLGGPIASVLMPRMTALYTRNDELGLLSLYRRATQWVGLMVWPTCGVLAIQSERFLWVWTGDAELAAMAAPILSLYALGNGAMAIGAFPYYLQFAKGQLRLHLLGTFLFVLVLMPCLFWATSKYGAIGAGGVWLTVNCLYFALWTPIAHAKYAPGLHIQWLLYDVAPVATVALAVALVSRWLPWPQDRLLAGIEFLAVSTCVFLASMVASSWFRDNWKSAGYLRRANRIRTR